MNTNHIYMAGLLDGEGTIGIARSDTKGRFRAPYISISSTTPEIIQWLKETYGGHVSIQKTYQDHHKQAWSWKLRNLSDLYDLLDNVLPFMLEPDKIRRGTLILNEYKAVTPRNGKYTSEMLERKQEFESRFLSIVE